MKAVVGSVLAAVGASACCLGPVVLSLVGAGAFAATAARLEIYRAYFLILTFFLLGTAFYVTYRPAGTACRSDAACAPDSRRTAKITLWIVMVVVALLVTFPYYIGWFV